MKLVHNWKEGYKFFTNIISFIGIILMTLLTDLPSHIVASWSLIPDEIKSTLPPEVVAGIAIVIFILNIISRLIKQFPEKEKETKKEE